MNNKFENLEDIENIDEFINSLSEEELIELERALEEDVDRIITLNDENGDEARFEFLDLIPYEGEEYVVLLPCDESDEAGEVVILKIEELGDDSETYVSVDDEDTLNVVFEIFKEKFREEFNFVD